MDRLDEIKAKTAAMTKEFVRQYGVQKTELLKELNIEEKMENARSMKTDIIEALIRQYELCAGLIGFAHYWNTRIICLTDLIKYQCHLKTSTNLDSSCLSVL